MDGWDNPCRGREAVLGEVDGGWLIDARCRSHPMGRGLRWSGQGQSRLVKVVNDLNESRGFEHSGFRATKNRVAVRRSMRSIKPNQSKSKLIKGSYDWASSRERVSGAMLAGSFMWDRARPKGTDHHQHLNRRLGGWRIWRRPVSGKRTVAQGESRLIKPNPGEKRARMGLRRNLGQQVGELRGLDSGWLIEAVREAVCGCGKRKTDETMKRRTNSLGIARRSGPPIR